MDRVSSLETKSFCSSGKVENIKTQKIDSTKDSKRNRNYRNFFRRKFQKNNLRKLPFLSSSPTSLSFSLSTLPSILSSLTMRKNERNYAVLVLTILLGLIQNSLSSPVFVDNPSIAQFQSGRNIRHLPCIVRKSGLSGTCMFAIDCIKQNGTHLGTCIDRFYFGSCCRIKDDYFAQDINDNSIDQNTISHFLNDINTTPSTIGSYKPTIQQELTTHHKTKPTLPVPYVPISTVIPSMQNRENSVNSSSSELFETNSLINNSKIAILSSSQTSSVSVSSSSLPFSSSKTPLQIPSQNVTEQSLNELQTLFNLSSTENLTTPSSLQTHSFLSSLLSSSLNLSLSNTTLTQKAPLPTKPMIISNKPTSTAQQTTSHKTTSTHKISSFHTAANEVLKETSIISKTPSTHPTKETHVTKHTPTKEPLPLTSDLTTITNNKIITSTKNTYPTKLSTFVTPILTTLHPSLITSDSQIRDTTESLKLTTFQVVETTTFVPTATPTTKFETQKTTVASQTSTKTPSPIIYASNKPLYTKRPLTTNRTKGTKRPPQISTKPTKTIPSNEQLTTTTTINSTSKKTTTSPTKKPLIVTKRPLTTRPPISKPTSTVQPFTLTTTSTPHILNSSTKRTDLYKTDVSTTTKIPLTTTKIDTQSTKAPRPNPKPTAEIVRVPYTTLIPDTDLTTTKTTTTLHTEDISKVNLSSTTSKTDSLHSPITSQFSTTTKIPLTTLSTTLTSILQIKTTNRSPSTTVKPLPSILTKKPLISTSSTSTSSFKQPTTKQPSFKPSSTRYPGIKPSIITSKPSQSTSILTTTKGPSVNLSKSTASPSKLPIITKQPLTTKPPIFSSSSTTKAASIKPEQTMSSTIFQLTQTTTTTTTTVKPTGLVTWTNIDNTPKNNISVSFNTSNINNESWQPKPMPDWALKPASVLEINKTKIETPSSSPKPNTPTTEDIIASSITSVLDQLNNITANNMTHTTDSSWAWTTETRLNTSSTTLSSSIENTANATSNGTASINEGFGNATSSTVSPIPTLEGIDYKQICGKRMYPEPRIVGGANAAFGRWPWQISLRQWRTSTYLHKCGAALLNENWAITAAHCVDNVPPSDLLLRLGEYDLAEEEEPYSYQERRVQIVASHPQFDPRTFEYDLALLRFYEPVIFQPNIIPVCVPDNDYDFLGQTAYVTGWGRLYEDGPLPSVLQEVSVPVINNTICETMYRAAGYIEHIPHIFICAGWKKGGYDSCEGDSGGPMVLQRERDKRFVLGGVISWGIGCAEPNQPGVYTRISEFRDWINQILQF